MTPLRRENLRADRLPIAAPALPGGATLPGTAEDLELALDRQSETPLYLQLAAQIEMAIREDRLRAGMRVENEIALSQRLGLARPTVRHAIEQLVDKGLLVRRRGIGTQVVQAPAARDVGIRSLDEDRAQSGANHATMLVSQTLAEADADAAAALGLEPAAEVLRIVRIRFADNRPLAILDSALLSSLGPLSDRELETTSLYWLLDQRAAAVRIADQLVGAREATPLEAAMLQLREHEPVLTVTRTAFDKTGRAVEYGRHCFAPDRYALRYSLVSK